MLVDIDARIHALKQQLLNLLGSPVTDIERVINDPSSKYKVPGIYAISLPGDQDDIVYIGKTNTKTIQGRIKDHVSIKETSDLSGMVKRDPSLPQAVLSYHVRMLQVPEERDRSNIEYFAISVMSPRLNK